MSEDEVKIRALQEQWMNAWKNQDQAALESILADDFTVTVSSAPEKPTSRATWLEMAAGSYICESFRYESMSVRLFAEIAVVASLYRQKASVKGIDRSGQFFLTDIWRKSEQGWRVAARYSSFPEAQSQSSRALEQ